MAFINDYKPEEYNVVFDVEDGDHEIMIKSVDDSKVSKKGQRMLIFTFACDSTKGLYTHYLCEGEYFNSNMTKLFDCMGLPRGDFNLNHWIGRKLMAHFQHEANTWMDNKGVTHQGTRCNLKYFLTPSNEEPEMASNYQESQFSTPSKTPNF